MFFEVMIGDEVLGTFGCYGLNELQLMYMTTDGSMTPSGGQLHARVYLMGTILEETKRIYCEWEGINVDPWSPVRIVPSKRGEGIEPSRRIERMR